MALEIGEGGYGQPQVVEVYVGNVAASKIYLGSTEVFAPSGGGVSELQVTNDYFTVNAYQRETRLTFPNLDANATALRLTGVSGGASGVGEIQLASTGIADQVGTFAITDGNARWYGSDVAPQNTLKVYKIAQNGTELSGVINIEALDASGNVLQSASNITVFWYDFDD